MWRGRLEAYWGRRIGFCRRITKSNQAFTLTELAVVVATITVLGVLLLPALATSHDRSDRAVCQYHLRQIAVAATIYAADNSDTLFPVSKASYGLPIFQPNVISATDAVAKQVGLNTNLSINNIWTCPNRPGLPVQLSSGSWVIGYQYFGGITTWSASPTGRGYSPVKMTQAKPYWTLAADALLKVGSSWAGQVSAGGSYEFEYGNIPSHHTTDSNSPQGGNQVFCDGSVRWIDLEEVHRFISYPGAIGQIDCCFYQDSVDFDAPFLARLPALAVTP